MKSLSKDLLLIISSLLVCITVQSKSKNSCNSYFSKTTYGQIRSSFEHNIKYDVELPKIPIKDQCSFGHCHLYTWISELELQSGIDLSSDHIDIMNLYTNTVNALKNQSTQINDGSYPLDSRNTINRFGLIPKSAWIGQSNYKSGSTSRKLISGLIAILTNTKEILESTPIAEQEKIIEEAEDQIFDYINNIAGPIPKKFIYQDQEYTPIEFAEKFFPGLKKPAVYVWTSAGSTENNIQESNLNLTFPNIKIELTKKSFEDHMVAILNSGRPVYLAYNNEEQFIDFETGIMSISAFHYPKIAKLTTSRIISKHFKWKGGHAVLIVGYQKNPNTGAVVKWKIQNSWGDQLGDRGYFHMYNDYMRLFGFGFSYVSDSETIDLNL